MTAAFDAPLRSADPNYSQSPADAAGSGGAAAVASQGERIADDRAQSLMQQAPFDYFEAGKSLPEAELLYAMVYALDGGKALRAFLVIESARLHGQGLEAATRAGLAVECIHAYSLIHDDLPCMDDDDLRRGKPTVHKKWNEHTAVLAGDALQAKGFELLTSEDMPNALPLLRGLAEASGHGGMVVDGVECEHDAVINFRLQPLFVFPFLIR